MAALLGDKNIGDIVKIAENGTPVEFIIIHKGNPKASMYSSPSVSLDLYVWVVRKNSLNTDDYWNFSPFEDRTNDYENSTIRDFLNNTYKIQLDERVRARIPYVRIPFYKNDSNEVFSGNKGLSVPIFLLSVYEVGFTTADDKAIFLLMVQN